LWSSIPFDLQQELLHNLFQRNLHSKCLEEYYWSFDVFKQQRVFIIIVDDIDDKGHLGNLVPNIELISYSSHIIITSQHYSVLNNAMEQKVYKNLYEVKVLNCIY